MDEKQQVVVEAIRSNLSAFGHHPFRAVNNKAAIAALQRALPMENGEARELCRVAVEQHFGGYIEPRIGTEGLRGGHRPRRTIHETWWVDTAKIA